MSRAYISMELIEELGVGVMGFEKLVPLKDHADGLIGMFPVFESAKAAKAYSDKEITIIEITLAPKEQHITEDGDAR